MNKWLCLFLLLTSPVAAIPELEQGNIHLQFNDLDDGKTASTTVIFRATFEEVFPDIVIPNNVSAGAIKAANPTMIHEMHQELGFSDADSLAFALKTYVAGRVAYQVEGSSFQFNGAAGAVIWSSDSKELSTTSSPMGLTGFFDSGSEEHVVSWLASSENSEHQAFINDFRRYTNPVNLEEGEKGYRVTLMKDRSLATVWYVANGIPSSAQSIAMTEDAMREVGDWPYVDGLRPGWLKVTPNPRTSNVYRKSRSSYNHNESESPFDWDFSGYQGVGVSEGEIILMRPCKALPNPVDLALEFDVLSIPREAKIEVHVMPGIVRHESHSDWESIRRTYGGFRLGVIQGKDFIPTHRVSFDTRNRENEAISMFRYELVGEDFTVVLRFINPEAKLLTAGFDKFTLYHR